ncbi:hypothetical protein [uncultured Nostoc sp.]|uniref:hypothetical protein n=1 Tax=uncultured Nostoc sp. TaxID=340711 RepID=UPI0035CB7B5E
MAKFVANNNNPASTRLSLFFASKGLYPHINFDVIDFLDTTTCKWIKKKKL